MLDKMKRKGERDALSKKNHTAYEDWPQCEKYISNFKYPGNICNKILCCFLGLDERRDKRT